nr:hypothetical protein [uncultured Shinella sp.]
MTFKIEIRGMSFFYSDDGTRKYRTLAMAEVYLPDLAVTLRDVRLAWSTDRGFVAHAPTSPKTAPQPMVQWYHRGEFAQQLAQELRVMYERMGGKMPEELAVKEHRAGAASRRIIEKASSRRDHVTGKVIGADPFERRGISMARVIDFKDQAAGRDEAVEGLLRTLGVEQQEAARVCG